MKSSLRGWRLWTVVAAGLVALYAVIGFFVVPPVARNQIERRATEKLGRQTTVARVGFNPFTFAGTVEGFRVAGSDNHDLASWKRLDFNFDAWESLFRLEWRFGDVTLDSPSGRLAIDDSGRLNIQDILSRSQPPAGKKPPSGPPKVGMDRFTVHNGSIQFADRSVQPAFDAALTPIDFTLEDFSTSKGSQGGVYRLSGRTPEGESLEWQGTLSATPAASSGQLAFSGVALPRYMPFLHRFLNGEVTHGTASVTARYEFAAGTQRRAVIRDLKLQTSDVSLSLPDQKQPVLTLPNFELDAPEVRPLERSAHVARVAAQGWSVRAVRESDGSIDLASLLKSGSPASPAQAPAAPTQGTPGTEPPFAVTVDSLDLEKGSVAFTDQSLKEPAELHAENLHLTASGFGPKLDAPVKVQGGLLLANGGGSLSFDGTVHPQPLSADLSVTGKALQLETAEPYLREFAAADVTSGTTDIDGRLQLSSSGGAPVALTWTGSTQVRDVAVQGPQGGEPVLALGSLAANGIEFQSQDRQLTVNAVELSGPALHLAMQEDGSFNVNSLLPGGASGQKAADNNAPEAPAQAQTKTAAGAMKVKLNQVKITGGRITFRDQSVHPVPQAEISDIQGALTQLSTEPGTSGRVDLTATVLKSPPARLQGTVNLLGKDMLSDSDLTLSLKGVQLDALQPYAVKYLGYRIQKGRMQGDFDYRLKGDALSGQNHVVLRDFYLGEQVPSDTAMSLPIKLALAVLRDRDGRIVLNVPVSGSLKSPQFSFAGAIEHAFQNTFAKVATAPFALLGSLFGAPDTDLSEIAFSPGTNELTDETRKKLDTLARALQERPGLELTLRWVPAPGQDRAALVQQRVDTLVAQKKQELGTPASISDRVALAALYAERVQRSPLGPQAGRPEEAQASSEAAREAWYRHWFDLVFGPGDKTAKAPEGRQAAAAPAQPTVSPEQMRQELASTVKLPESAFTDVARSRAQAARDYLAGHGVDAARVEVAGQPGAPEGKPADQPRVYFTLDEAGSPSGS